MENVGLTSEEARRRLQSYGANVVTSSAGQNALRRLGKVLAEPMLLLLVGLSAFYVIAGEPIESAFVIVSLGLVITISFIQETRSANAVNALRDLSQPFVHVFRDSELRQRPVSELVPGDVVLIGEGDRIPADGRVLETVYLSLDESVRTGESHPSVKAAGDSLFTGSLVSSGQARMLIEKTGLSTSLGSLGTLLSKPDDPTFLTSQTKSAVRGMGVLAFFVCVAITAGLYAKGTSVSESILVGLAAAIALLPEEFPMITTLFSIMGAWRLAKHAMISKTPQGIERLGAMTDLCIDKTGTLTENRMTITETFSRKDDLLKVAALASLPNSADAIDRCLQTSVGEGVFARLELVRHYGLTSEDPMIVCAWRDPDSGRIRVCAKGAPEALLARAKGKEIESFRARLREMASQGQRVIGVAEQIWNGGEWPANSRGFDFEPIGLIGFADPLRPEVPAAIARCRSAGIRVIMMTGDNPQTALSIARQAGLVSNGEALTGDGIASLAAIELDERLDRTPVIARMKPDQKLQTVRLLRSLGHVVAMTGDGINDASSLRTADVGIAMGRRGTDVAKEAADFILADDKFASIVEGIDLGRRIFHNIQSALSYVIAIHVPIAGLTLLAALSGIPLILTPIHLICLELVIDPVSLLLFESRRPVRDEMSRPPRPARSRLFSRDVVQSGLIRGTIILLTAVGLYVWFDSLGLSVEMVRSSIFLAVVLGHLALIVTSSSDQSIAGLRAIMKNKVFVMIVGAVTAGLCLIYLNPPLRDAFDMSALTPLLIGGALVASLLGVAGSLALTRAKVIR